MATRVSRRRFTLIELLVMAAILALSISLLVPFLRRANDETLRTDTQGRSRMKTQDTRAIDAVLSPATAQHPRQTEASMLAFPDGRLLLAYSDFYDGPGRDEDPAQIAGRWSKDEGQTWSEPFVLQENIGKINCMSASLLQLPSGRMLLAFGRKDAQPGLLHAMVKYSDDEGQTWSEPKDITRGDNYWCITNDRLVRLSNGRILYPIEARSVGCHVWYSDDDGATWQMSRENIARPEGIHYAEPTVVELKDGRVAMYIRSNAGNLHIALSDDGGESWRTHKTHAPDMAGHPDCGPNAAESPCMVKRVPGSDDLLLVWNNNRVRTPLTAAISSDNGETWRHFRDIEAMDGWPPRLIHTYPSITFLNGNAHLTYGHVHLAWRDEKPPKLDVTASLKYRRLPLEWFYEKP